MTVRTVAFPVMLKGKGLTTIEVRPPANFYSTYCLLHNTTPSPMVVSGVTDNPSSSVTVSPGTIARVKFTGKRSPLNVSLTPATALNARPSQSLTVDFSDDPNGSDISGSYPASIPLPTWSNDSVGFLGSFDVPEGTTATVALPSTITYGELIIRWSSGTVPPQAVSFVAPGKGSVLPSSAPFLPTLVGTWTAHLPCPNAPGQELALFISGKSSSGGVLTIYFDRAARTPVRSDGLPVPVGFRSGMVSTTGDQTKEITLGWTGKQVIVLSTLTLTTSAATSVSLTAYIGGTTVILAKLQAGGAGSLVRSWAQGLLAGEVTRLTFTSSAGKVTLLLRYTRYFIGS